MGQQWGPTELLALGRRWHVDPRKCNAANAITIPFDDPVVQWTYPWPMGIFMRTFFACEDTLFSLPYTLDGAVTGEVDAFGSLVLPTGVSISEVLRAVRPELHRDLRWGHGHLVACPDHVCCADSLLPVFFHEQLVVTDPASLVLLEATDVPFNNTVVSIAEQEEQSFVAAYPNRLRRAAWCTGRWPPSAVARSRCGRPFARQGTSRYNGVVGLQTEGWRGLVLLVKEGQKSALPVCSAVVGPLMLTKKTQYASGIDGVVRDSRNLRKRRSGSVPRKRGEAPMSVKFLEQLGGFEGWRHHQKPPWPFRGTCAKPAGGSEAGANPTSDGWPHCALVLCQPALFERCEVASRRIVDCKGHGGSPGRSWRCWSRSRWQICIATIL